MLKRKKRIADSGWRIGGSYLLVILFFLIFSFWTLAADNSYREAKQLLAKKQYEAALDKFQDSKEEEPLLHDYADYYRAYIFYLQNESTRAEKEFGRWLATYPKSGLKDKAEYYYYTCAAERKGFPAMETDSLLKLAKAAWLQQDKDKAGQIWRWCYVNRPQDSRAEETMHDLARYDTWRGNHPERKTLMDRLIALGSEMAPRLFYMLGDYDKILLSYPKSSVADNVLFYRGLNAYLQGQVAGSAKYLQQLLDTIPDGDRRGAALYWMAKIHERQSRPQQAESLLKELVKEYPYDYWAYRAAKKLGQPDNGSLAMCPLSKKYERLAQLGCYDDVGLEIQGECRKDDRNLFYVRPFWPTILKTAERYNVDPHLVAAVIREESRYNPVAISRSGAVGLMQLMPRTARIVADQLGLSNFSTGQLIDPQINILLGTKYLQELQCRFFVGDEINAIASYNAGPGAMKRWKKKYGPIVDEDVYIEKIPYPETREYVKKVLRSYWVYKSATADEKTVML